jgi:hypothetical protein
VTFAPDVERRNLPPAPPHRDEQGIIDVVASLVDTTGPTDDERADQITIERLATASQPLGT